MVIHMRIVLTTAHFMVVILMTSGSSYVHIVELVMDVIAQSVFIVEKKNEIVNV